jgi:hypothetical protein
MRTAVVASSVECRGCGYDLQGLAVAGSCPECGLALVETITALVDPEASRLPRLTNPRAVGKHLFGVTACLAASALVVLAEPAWMAVTAARWRPPLVGLALPDHLPLMAAVLALLAVWPALRLLPPVGAGPSVGVRREVWLLVIGTIGWTGATLLLPWAGDGSPILAVQLVLAAAAVVALLGLGGILRTIGRRSRAYRRSRAGRQSVYAMIAAVGGAGIGLVLRAGWDRWGLPADLRSLATVAVAVCALMAAIGLPYLGLNAWWIRTALRRPPPTLDELLLPSMPADARLPMADEDEDGDG